MINRILIIGSVTAILAGIWLFLRYDMQKEANATAEVESLDHNILSRNDRFESTMDKGPAMYGEGSAQQNATVDERKSPRSAPMSIRDLDPDSIKMSDHIDPEAAEKAVEMLRKLQNKPRPNSDEDRYTDSPTYREQPGQRLADYYEKWHSEQENTETSESGRDWLLEQFSLYDIPADDVEVSCRETLCRMRITVPGKGGIEALERFPINNRSVILSDPVVIQDQVILAVYHPIENGKLDLEDN